MVDKTTEELTSQDAEDETPVEEEETDKDTIYVFGLKEDAARFSLFKKKEELEYGRTPVPLKELKQNLAAFLENMDNMLQQLPDRIGEFHLDTMTITVEVSAKGSLSLLGSGGELAGKGGITFTLTRQK